MCLHDRYPTVNMSPITEVRFCTRGEGRYDPETSPREKMALPSEENDSSDEERSEILKGSGIRDHVMI